MLRGWWFDSQRFKNCKTYFFVLSQLETNCHISCEFAANSVLHMYIHNLATNMSQWAREIYNSLILSILLRLETINCPLWACGKSYATQIHVKPRDKYDPVSDRNIQVILNYLPVLYRMETECQNYECAVKPVHTKDREEIKLKRV